MQNQIHYSKFLIILHTWTFLIVENHPPSSDTDFKYKWLVLCGAKLPNILYL